MRSKMHGVAALAVAATLAVGACSSSKSSSSSSAPPATTPPTTAVASTGIQAAQTAVQAALQRPTKIEVTQPLGVPVPKGKTVDWIQCSIPACTQLGQALKQGTDALGWNLDIIDGGITPETIANAWSIAVRNKHDAVIGSGFPRSIFETQIQTLAKANTPVILIDVTDPPGNGVTAIIQGATDYPPNGALMADWVLADGGTKANTVFVTTSAFPVVGARTQGFEDEYKKLCSSCQLDKLQAQATDFGDKLNTQVVAYLQGHPAVNYVVAGVSDMVTGLTSALSSAGLSSKVKVLTNDINPALQQDIQNSTALKAVTMMENTNMMWQTLDVIVRKLAGQSIDATVNAKPNMWIVDKNNIAGFQDPYPIVADYQSQYKQLWGV
jgi:ribose transport system substrate-binding protein